MAFHCVQVDLKWRKREPTEDKSSSKLYSNITSLFLSISGLSVVREGSLMSWQIRRYPNATVLSRHESIVTRAEMRQTVVVLFLHFPYLLFIVCLFQLETVDHSGRLTAAVEESVRHETVCWMATCAIIDERVLQVRASSLTLHLLYTNLGGMDLQKQNRTENLQRGYFSKFLLY